MENNAKALYERGNENRVKGNNDQAIEDYTESIQLDPRPFTYAARGQAYAARCFNKLSRGITDGVQEDIDMAFSDFNLVIRRAPDAADGAYAGRGLLYYAQQDYNQAIEDFLAALKINPNQPEALLYLEKARQEL